MSSGPKPRAQGLKPILAVLLLLWAPQAVAQTPDPIRYTVSFPAPHTHYLEVEASYPTEGRGFIDLMMAVWTPGSYLIREYERHVEALTAADLSRAPLAVEKTRKNRWRVTTNGARTVSVRYRVYAHEMTVRTNWVDEEFAMINGAPTFITLLESPSRRAHVVRLDLPRTWAGSFSGMTPGPGVNTYVAADYDTLVDSPIVAGSPSVYEFPVRGKTHYLVNFRERGVWNGPQAARDLAKIAQTTAEFWGDAPFDRYYFFNVIGSTANGLEHKNSTLMNIPLEATQSREGYLEWLSLASHEYFHAWNVKRLRPVELGPFDYENEVYTKALWFVEGITDYYADLLLARAGVSTREEYLDALSKQIRALHTTPGRLEQSVESASYDAWIKYYRADENTPNTAISYYVKGAVIGFVLDAHIRHATNGAKSLHDVMRVMRERFSGEKGFSREDARAVVAEVVGSAKARDARTLMARVLETTAELDYTEVLEWFGLRMTPPATAPRAYLGIASRIDNGKTVVSGIRRGSPAAAAGMSLLDEIVAIDGEPLPAGQLASRLERLSPGANVTFTIARGGATRTMNIVLATDPGHGWQLSPAPAATRTQSQHLDAWLLR
ncbi:MAG TPA: PDZ domain-containing protein [Vicinamibacterales bacterium]|nr:PDZ domain-containing protein [Vicinamibacterales bacterium]